ncbi:MAG: molybdopterin converting factor subunit 1 [Pseudomonadales bacterium]|nr:molybdopterin converting factor subunit 1 [Pseudomonadales bacterium]MBO6564466.1 molybdopterin converting factor subunit 1 [Pseudomonadales bacterium]MBO6595228.1 molybdopterin converting factor subunit 1 [Pseudomonadales bacterium]MBO6658815.1 molybdopterin converting factor subunit 1 [Pseudomonadales bacterium]MBO6701736.1 molybdopterin converting factor subunit 1 [Pseudomonadales bacterium]
MATVIFFASIREDLGTNQMSVDIESGTRVSALINALATMNGPEWGAILKAENIKIAVNQELITSDIELNAQDEVAFFPPVTGG